MRQEKLIFCFLVLLVLLALSGIDVYAAGDTLSGTPLPLAPPAQHPPYDDEQFFQQANSTILQLCNGKTLPAGNANTAFHDALAGTYYSLIKMNISTEQYAKAEKVITFLSYTLTLDEDYQNYEQEKEKMSPVDMGLYSYADLESTYQAASKAWRSIHSWYPDAQLYTMPPAIESTQWSMGTLPIA